MASRTCWHCGKDSHTTIVGEPSLNSYDDSDGSTIWSIFFLCDSCHYPSIGQFEVDDVEQLTLRYRSLPIQTEEAPYANSQWKLTFAAIKYFANNSDIKITWIPVKSVGKEYENVPTDIASAASEAYACFSINANRAAVLLARTTVEAIAKDNGISSGTLQTKIETMAQKNIITNQLKDEAHEIRFLGNDMAHGDLGTQVVESDASDILGFLDTLLDYVYQQPMAIQKRRSLRAERKQLPTDHA